VAHFALSVSRDINRLLLAKGLRAFGDGFISLLLPVYLLQLGFSAFEVGLIATTTLVGSGLLSLAVGLHAFRFGYRSLLLAASALMAATGLGFAFLTEFWPLMLVALIGTLNPSSGDVSVFLPLEHAVLSQAAGDRQRTAMFAGYSLVGAVLGAVGSLLVVLPADIEGVCGMSALAALQAMFVFYALLAVLAGAAYRGLPKAAINEVVHPTAPLQQSKKAVYTLAALFSLDAFGGGFVVQSMLALWLFQRFNMSLETAAEVFFWTGLLTAASYLAAVRLAGRFGLVNTMVFTHIPSSICLLVMPFVSDIKYAIALLFIRGALSQMDVPTRSSYVMAIVQPAERPAAASVTSVPRSLASAVSPMLAGYMLALSSFGWPLIAAGGVKIVYDLLLLWMFRKLRPPEEENL
jgi:MFS family permease